jgi:hypothetical protein
VCSDTPQGERVCHDNKKSTLKKAQSQSLNSKKYAFACAFLVDNPRQGGKRDQIPTPPKPQTLNAKPNSN